VDQENDVASMSTQRYGGYSPSVLELYLTCSHPGRGRHWDNAEVSDPDLDPGAAPGAAAGGPPSPNLAFLVINLGRTLRDEVDEALHPLGLSMRHLSALGHLSRQPGLSYSELARRAGITPQSMQATLLQLERLQAVERRTSAGRGRTAQLHVTAAGSALLGQGQHAVRAAEARLLADVPPEHQAAFTAALTAAFHASTRRRAP
jgi:DNA-binding MarR family transcriptional regulator